MQIEADAEKESENENKDWQLLSPSASNNKLLAIVEFWFKYLSKSDIKILLNKKNTVVTSVLSSLKEKELCIETRNGRYFYYLANLDRIVYF